MDIVFLKSFFLWASLINYGVLLLWLLMLTFTRDALYSIHGRWFPMSKESFSVCHYVMFGLYKLTIIFFGLVPYIVICLLD